MEPVRAAGEVRAAEILDLPANPKASPKSQGPPYQDPDRKRRNSPVAGHGSGPEAPE